MRAERAGKRRQARVRTCEVETGGLEASRRTKAQKKPATTIGALISWSKASCTPVRFQPGGGLSRLVSRSLTA